jgi:hypothetical protein
MSIKKSYTQFHYRGTQSALQSKLQRQDDLLGDMSGPVYLDPVLRIAIDVHISSISYDKIPIEGLH